VSLSALDVFILLPLVPVAPFVLMWWLPWERWLSAADSPYAPFNRIPKKYLGPYLLYVSFAFWHFQLPWWTVVSLLVAGVVVSGLAVREVLSHAN
jgi:hypothetical protein